jgi:beta-galactosidase
MWPDRTPHPALYEFKKLAQPLRVEAVDPAKGKVLIVNKQDFTSLDWLDGKWELTVEGTVLLSGNLPALAIAPGESLNVTLDGVAAEQSTGERFLNFHFFQRQNTKWASAGHEVAWEQIALPSRTSSNVGTPNNVEIASSRTQETEHFITLQLENRTAVFDKLSGVLTELSVNGANPILRGPLCNVWRAGTDNDGIKLQDGQAWKALPRWLALGLNKVNRRVKSIKLTDGSVVEIVHEVSGREHWQDFEHVHRYRFLPSGELSVENTITLGEGIRDIPRIGVELILQPTLEQLEWMGRGPWDNYADRKASAMVGRFQSTVTDQYVPYIMPQEHGHKTEVRWLTLTEAGGHGLKIMGQSTIEFSVSHFEANDLFNAQHTFELRPRAEVILNLDLAQRGLGTASCGPDTLQEYCLLASSYEFSYLLQLF